MTLTPRTNSIAVSSLWSDRRQKDAGPDRIDNGGAPGHGDSDSVRVAAGFERGVHAQQHYGHDPRAASAHPTTKLWTASAKRGVATATRRTESTAGFAREPHMLMRKEGHDASPDL